MWFLAKSNFGDFCISSENQLYFFYAKTAYCMFIATNFSRNISLNSFYTTKPKHFILKTSVNFFPLIMF